MHLLYKTDVWHTHQSRELKAVAKSFEGAVDAAVAVANKQGIPLSEYDVDLLYRIKQTQNYEGEGEFLIESAEDSGVLMLD